jgi:hypothetical protein
MGKCYCHLSSVEFLQDLVIGRSLVFVHTLAADRFLAIFLVTRAIAYAVRSGQASEGGQEKLFKPTTIFLELLYPESS